MLAATLKEEESYESTYHLSDDALTMVELS